MSEELELACFNIITHVGTARSNYINAIQLAKEGKYDEADEMIKNGEKEFVEGHHAHADMLTKEANGELGNAGVLLIHAEDQLMSAEAFKIIAEELIEIYKRLDKKADA